MTNDELLWTTNIWRELEDHLSELERATGKGTPKAGEYAVSALDIGMCPSIVLNQSYIHACIAYCIVDLYPLFGLSVIVAYPF